MINIFNYQSGKKLNKFQKFIIKILNFIEFLFRIYPLWILIGVIYIILHFIIKYW
jgi:hypothetical protein